MAAPKKASESETGRIVPFPARISSATNNPYRRGGSKADPDEAAVQDLRKYEQGAEFDDYGRRMIVNVIAFAFIVLLTLAGIWLAEQMASLRKSQDCVITGRNNCAETQPVRNH